jgi:hypothetical protein
MGTKGSFPGDKAAGAWSWPPPASPEVKEWVELYPHSPNTPSERGAQLKHRDNFTFTFPLSVPFAILINTATQKFRNSTLLQRDGVTFLRDGSDEVSVLKLLGN